MWYVISGLLVMYVILRVLIRHAEKKFNRVNAEELAQKQETSKKYLREGDDLVGFANAVVRVNQQRTYVKMYLKNRRIYWLAKILTFSYVGNNFFEVVEMKEFFSFIFFK